jgi:hypothetical protein
MLDVGLLKTIVDSMLDVGLVKTIVAYFVIIFRSFLFFTGLLQRSP